LTSTPDLGLSKYQERFNLLKSSGTYYILVIIDKTTDQVVATGTNMAEYKLIRNAGTIGHIEDIAVSKTKQGQRLGWFIVTALTELGESVGFYKSILDCDEKNRGMSCFRAVLHTSIAPPGAAMFLMPLNVFSKTIGFYEKCGHEYKGIQMAKYSEKLGKM
jgi:glucosamine-phosphate N-acetyltransferase